MNFPMTRRGAMIRVAVAAATLSSKSSLSAADGFPTRAVRIVVPVPPGGGTDTVARLVAERLSAKFGQPVIVENRAGGAAGSVGAEYVSHSEPDGHTLLLAAPGPLALNKFLYPRLGYDPSDFVPISIIASIRSVLVVRSDSPFKSIQDLIKQAKANPGKLTYGSGGVGTTFQLAWELLKKLTAAEIMHVPYKGDAASTIGMLQGQVDMKFAELSTALPHIKSGRMRVLAVSEDSRNPMFPSVPTIAEVVVGFRTSLWYGLVAPPKTSAAVAAKLSSSVTEVLSQPEIVAKMHGLNIQPIGTNAAEMRRIVIQDAEYWGRAIRSMNIKAA